MELRINRVRINRSRPVCRSPTEKKNTLHFDELDRSYRLRLVHKVRQCHRQRQRNWCCRQIVCLDLYSLVVDGLLGCRTHLDMTLQSDLGCQPKSLQPWNQIPFYIYIYLHLMEQIKKAAFTTRQSWH